MTHFMTQTQGQNSDPSVLFVCLLGVGVVFVGLVLLIAIVSLSNALLSKLDKSQNDNDVQANNTAPVQLREVQNKPIENRQEILAAVCAAVAEENGTDISAIRVISFKKL